MNRLSLCVGLPALLMLVAALGCGPATTSQALIGTWEGRPDTVAAKRARNPIPTAPGYEEVAANEAAEASDEIKALQPSETTDLEAYDFTVLLEFQPQGRIAMQLNGGQLIEGAWRVLSTDVGVSIIEIADGAPPKDDQDAAETPPPTVRRFALQLDKDYQGFTLREEGVDPRFGWLYFQRVH